MRRIYVVWFMREVAPQLVLQVLALGALAFGIHEFVSVKFVLRNALEAVSGIPSLITFGTAAVKNTGFIAQMLLAASLLLGLMILRDFRRVIRRLASPGMLQLVRSR